ncbi:MAG TPA: HAMP domain-containing protein [Candidatus Polarisedimenticolia bacterium]|nr:HAMP domain-containing protein [Candidatus Polarisedimenticolia bacterium]
MTGLSLFYLNEILEDVLSITQVDARIIEGTRAMQTHLDSATSTELAYVLLREESFLEQNRRSMEAIRQTSLEGLSHLGTEGTFYERIPELTSQYSLTLARLADLYASPSAGDEPLAEFETDLLRLGRRVRALKDQAASERDPAAKRRLFEEMRRATDSLAPTLVESSVERDPSRAQILQELIRIRERIRSIAEGIQDRALAHVEEHRLHVVSLSNRARRNLLTTIPLTGLVGIYLVLFLPSRVVRSLRRITHVLQQAERGDLDVATLETGSDEVGSLAAHLNRVLRQLRTFDELKSERMLRAEQRLAVLVENLETGILLADDQMEPVFVSRRARQLLDSKPEGADDARIAGLLQDEDFSELLKEVLSTQARCEPRFVDLEVGASEPRRLRLWVEPVLSPTGDVREMILLIRKAG